MNNHSLFHPRLSSYLLDIPLAVIDSGCPTRATKPRFVGFVGRPGACVEVQRTCARYFTPGLTRSQFNSLPPIAPLTNSHKGDRSTSSTSVVLRPTVTKNSVQPENVGEELVRGGKLGFVGDGQRQRRSLLGT